MELVIYSPKEDGFIKSIDWNYEELKEQITEKAEMYMSLVYSEDQMKEAKRDRADLNRFKKALNAKRIDVKKQVMDPYTTFEEQMKELVSIVDKAVSNIDVQVKGYEEGLRQEKDEKCRSMWEECIGDLIRTVPYDKIRKEEWLKRSISMKAIKEDMMEMAERIDRELKLIGADFSKYVFEMKEEYLKEFNFQSAMELKQRLEETEKKKAIFEEEQKKAEEERRKALRDEASAIQHAGQTDVIMVNPLEEERKERTICVTFEVTARESQFGALNQTIKELKEIVGTENVKFLDRKEI